MKSLIIILAVFASTLSSSAQGKNSASTEFSSTDSTVKQQISNVLSTYYQIKDALVSGNAKLASAKAKEFETALDAVDMKKMTPLEHTFYTPLQEKLAYDAQHIRTAPNIDHMREHFGPFSNNVWTLVKAFKANNGIAYQQYCPMQKATWISKDEAIKNPYYGSQMLTCGKVTATLK